MVTNDTRFTTKEYVKEIRSLHRRLTALEPAAKALGFLQGLRRVETCLQDHLIDIQVST